MAEKWLKLDGIVPSKVTPMVRQYIEAKAECRDSLLFFRMGDFYERFFDDALEAAETSCRKEIPRLPRSHFSSVSALYC